MAFQSVRSQRAVLPSRVGVLCSETGIRGFPVLNETMKGCSVMRSIKSVLVALLAVLALGAVAASGASAHEYFIEGKSMKELGLKEEAVTSVGGPAQLFIQSGEIICESSSGVGAIREGGAGVMTLELSECRVRKPSGCSVSSIVLRNTTDNLVEVEGKLADEFAGENGGHQLFEMEITGTSCLLAGPWPVEGQITGLVVSETEKEVGELNFSKTSGTNIRTGALILAFTLKDKVKLSGANKGKKWSAKK